MGNRRGALCGDMTYDFILAKHKIGIGAEHSSPREGRLGGVEKIQNSWSNKCKLGSLPPPAPPIQGERAHPKSHPSGDAFFIGNFLF